MYVIVCSYKNSYFASSMKKQVMMNDLIEIYRRIEYLRNNGLKMKEIADFVDMAPSVLSALYSSVLPTYSFGAGQ